MISTFVRLLLLAAIVFSAAGLQAQKRKAAPVQAVYAEIVTFYKFRDGRVINTHGRYYRSQSGQTREESNLGAVIVDPAERTVTILSAERREARVFTMPEVPPVAPSQKRVPTVTGHSRVDGRLVTKTRMSGPRGEKQEMWTDDQLGLVLFARTESERMTTTKTMKNVSVRVPDVALFTIPNGYAINNVSLPASAASFAPGDGPTGRLPGGGEIR